MSIAKRLSVPRTAVDATIAAIALGALAWHARVYWPFLCDDALISLRYSQRLLDGHGLTWDDHRPVEGYSNLLWVLACALLGRLGVDLVAAARILGAIGMGGAVLVCIYAGRRFAWPAGLPAATSALLLAASGTVAIWTIGGLEQPLVALLLAAAAVLVAAAAEREVPDRRALRAAALALALLVLTRPDSPLFAVSLAAAYLFARRGRGDGRPGALQLIGAPLVCVATQSAFRLAYYGDWVPNAARVKLALTSERIADGAAYSLEGAAALAPAAALILLALLPGVRGRVAWRRVVCFGLPLVVWSAYVVAIGGDIFPGKRHLTPSVVLLALLIGEATAAALRARSRLRLALWPLAGLALVATADRQLAAAFNRQAAAERWEWDGEAIGVMLRRAFADARPLLAVDPAGCVPFWSELPAIDMLGLNDAQIARGRPLTFGRGWLGHEVGDGAYVLAREPDLVLFTLPEGGAKPRFRTAHELARLQEFRRRYTLVAFEAPRPRDDAAAPLVSRIWVRRDSPTIGIRRVGDALVVPGFLFNARARSRAVLDDDGALGVRVERGAPAELHGLRLPPGRHVFAAQASGGPAAFTLLRPDGEAPLRSGDSFELAAAQEVGLRVAVAGEPAVVREVRFTAPVVP